jgi:hypothetical protein
MVSAPTGPGQRRVNQVGRTMSPAGRRQEVRVLPRVRDGLLALLAGFVLGGLAGARLCGRRERAQAGWWSLRVTLTLAVELVAPAALAAGWALVGRDPGGGAEYRLVGAAAVGAGPAATLLGRGGANPAGLRAVLPPQPRRRRRLPAGAAGRLRRRPRRRRHGPCRGARTEPPRVPSAAASCVGLPGAPGGDGLVLLADAVVTGWHATELAGVTPAPSVGGFGAGAVGRGIMDGVRCAIDAAGCQATDRADPTRERPTQVVEDVVRLVNPTGRVGIAGVYAEKDPAPRRRQHRRVAAPPLGEPVQQGRIGAFRAHP